MSEVKSTEIEELFQLPISREINRVVKVEDEDQQVVQRELEEYVLTSLLEKHFVDVLEEIIESEHKTQDDPGIWISGFFGSGKSHFMKILGYVLENKSLNGRSAADVFKTRTQDETLRGAVDSVNSKFNSEVLMFQIGAKENKAGDEDISQIILREFNKEQGYAGTPWVAEIEKDLESRGKYQEFKEAIEEESGKTWEEARTQGLFIRKDIQKALSKIEDYSEEEAERAIEDVEENLVISPETVTRKILERVEKQEEESGEEHRYFVFLDEISQFIGEREEMLLELQSLVEKFGEHGDGKLWLGVTSQEKLDMLIEGVLAMSAEESKVRDRFPHRYDLRSQDLDQVVQERILKKDEEAVPLLSDFYEENSGRISTHYKLQNSREAGKIDEEAFLESYPFLPYQLEILPDIFSALRGVGGEDKLTGKERTLIDVTHSVFNDPHNLREKSVGNLVTLDVIFDEIAEEIDDEDVKTIENASPSDVDQELARRVLKALYLIQQLDWVPNTAENIATALYSEVGDVASFEDEVEEVLEELTGSYIGPSDDGYRFLSKSERDIEEEIASIKVMSGDVRRRSKKILKDLFSKADTVNYSGSTFDVSVVVDDETVSQGGEIELTAYSPVYQAFEQVNDNSIKTRSHSEENKIYWIAESVGEDLIDDIERVLRVDQVIEDKRNKKLSEEEREAVNQKQDDVQRLKNDIKKQLRDSFRKGTVVYKGNSDALDETNTRLEKIVERYAEEAVPRVFTKLDPGLANVQKSDIEKVFDDLGGRSPNVFDELNIVVDGELNPEARICEEIQDEIDERRRHGEETTGKAILEEFKSAPYGWDRNVVRIGVAVLFRNGSLVLNHQEKVYSSYKESGAVDLFTSIRKFKKTSFEEQETVSKQDRTRAKNLLNTLFDKKVTNTIQEVADGIDEVAEEWSQDCNDILPRLRRCSFPLLDEVEEIERHLNSVKAKDTYARTIEAFLDKEDELEELSKKVESVFEFEESGKLDKYEEMDEFLNKDWEKYTDLADSSNRVEINEEVEDRAENLRKRLDSELVIDNWSDAETDYSKIVQDYVNAYEELYEKRYEVYNEAVEEVREYADKLDVEDEEGVQDATETLRDKRGDKSKSLDTDENEHIGVSPEVNRLDEHIEAVDGTYKQNAEDKIEELAEEDDENGGLSKSKVSVSTVLSSEVIEDESDLNEAVSKLEDEVLSELESNDKVILK
jgi:hypothetical protein